MEYDELESHVTVWRPYVPRGVAGERPKGPRRSKTGRVLPVRPVSPEEMADAEEKFFRERGLAYEKKSFGWSFGGGRKGRGEVVADA